MKRKSSKIFQIAVVFIGTIVEAGLTSGQEIKKFFTSCGISNFIGITACGIFYIIMGSTVSRINIKYKLDSYGDIIRVVSPSLLGEITGIITTLYLISNASVVLAGSGALINQLLNIPKIIGSLVMVALAIFFLLRGTDGLIEVSSFIVLTLVITITTITVLYSVFCKDMISLEFLTKFGPRKTSVTLPTILHTGYDTPCCLGVLVPLNNQIKKPKTMFYGVTLGAIGLAGLSSAVNFSLTINQSYIHRYEIPLLFVTQRFGGIAQALLLVVIWLETFFTEVSDVYSTDRTLDNSFNIEFKKTIFIILIIALPISRMGSSKLIGSLCPLFGTLSLVSIAQIIYFYFKHRRGLN